MEEEKYDVRKMLDDMETKFKEGLYLINVLRHWTEEGYEKGVETMCDILDINYTKYVRSAIEQEIWGTKKED